MPTIDRPLGGEILVFSLGHEREHAADEAILARHGRNGRTLFKEGLLRVTMVVLGPGGGMPTHHAEGPIAIQPLHGRIRYVGPDGVRELGPGELLSAPAGAPHSVESDEGATFLLTVALPPEEHLAAKQQET